MSQNYLEHTVTYQNAQIHVRHYQGEGPAFVFMHGFPDNLHIYDKLISELSGRQIVTFDFLGWGSSDKPTDHLYTSAQQEKELQAVVDALKLDQIILVAHDSSGPVAINWALAYPQRVHSLILLNTYYGQSPTLRFPEFISLFAQPAYSQLTKDMVQNPSVIQWFLNWQAKRFGEDKKTMEILVPIIGTQFLGTPSTFSAFMGLTRDLHATLEKNNQRLPELKNFDKPVHIIFGENDQYLNTGVAHDLQKAFSKANLTLLSNSGHWPQIDNASHVAQSLTLV